MRRSLASLLILTTGSTICIESHAEWRCDCTTIVDSCTAEVTVEETFVEVSTPAAQCARVDYLIDGMPFVSLAVEGSAREDWISRNADPRVLVQSCQVCADNAGREVAEPAAPASQPAELAPLVAPQPVYPEQAQQRGIEGNVTVEFTVNPFGDTENVHVVSSQPAGIFDLAAVSAISRWRFPADGEREPVNLTETLEFSIGDFLFTQIPDPQARSAAESASRASNQCARETVTYNYGEMIEVGLINACAQPLTVFACAVGTGSLAQRWVCTSTEQNATMLVRPGDGRRGGSALVTAQGIQRRVEYAENFFVTRAPNTEYWWMACAGDDERCIAAARQWSQSLDRQAAHVNPQLLTRAEVSRSY